MPTTALVPSSALRPATLEWWTLTLATFYLLALWDFSGTDLLLMQAIGSAQGFTLRDNFWLSRIGHDLARQLATVLWLLLWVAVLRPTRWLAAFDRGERLQMALGATLALVAVNLIKRNSATSCPWDLDLFGGTAHWVSHWSWWIVSDGGPGHCFPGGHASAAFAFLSLAWPGLAGPPGSPRWRAGAMALAAVLAAGVLLGTVQTLRGAHPPSHTAWTAWLCWTTTGLAHALQARWRRRQLRPAFPPPR